MGGCKGGCKGLQSSWGLGGKSGHFRHSLHAHERQWSCLGVCPCPSAVVARSAHSKNGRRGRGYRQGSLAYMGISLVAQKPRFLPPSAPKLASPCIPLCITPHFGFCPPSAFYAPSGLAHQPFYMVLSLSFLYGAFPLAHLPLFGSGFHACPPCPLLPSLPLWRSAKEPCFLDLALGNALGLSVFCTRLSTALGVSGCLWLWDSRFYALSGSLPFGVSGRFWLWDSRFYALSDSLPFGVSGRFWLWDSRFYALSGSDLPCLWLWSALGIAKPHRRFFVSVGLKGFHIRTFPLALVRCR